MQNAPDERIVRVDEHVLIITGAELIERMLVSVDVPVTSLYRTAVVSPSGTSSPPAVPPAPDPAPERVSGATATVTLPDGSTVDIPQGALIGRAPLTDDGVLGLVVDDPHVSSTHLRIEIRDGAAEVTDLSTNGTMLKAPGELARMLTRWVPARVASGSTLVLAEGVEVTVNLPAV